MKSLYILLITFFLCSQSFADIKEKDILIFFGNITEKSKQLDESLIELYSDSAKITTNRVNVDGTIQKMELDGIKYKKLLKSSIELAKKRGDIDEFSDIKVTIESGRAIINANRYSKVKCTKDPEYQMVLVPKGNSFLIIEEHTLTYAFSKCISENQVELASLLKTEVARYKSYLGKMIDNETRLEKIEAIANTLFWVSTLINVSAKELSSEELTRMMKPILITQTCSMQNFSKILESNGIVSYTYFSKDGEQITSIPISIQDCSH